MSNLAAPRATIVVSLPRDAEALHDTVVSALEQTEQSIEVIVVGEPGATLRTLEELADPRLALVGCAGLGTWTQLNLGIALARADSIKLVVDEGATLEPSCIAREAAALDAHPTCAVVLPAPAWIDLDPTSQPRPHDAATLLAGLLQRDVPDITSALFLTDALRAVGGVDATLRRALAADLWLRVLPERQVLFLRERLVHVPIRGLRDDDAAAESRESRAEPGFALVRAVCDRGLDWWRDTIATATGATHDASAAWAELAALLLRSGLPEAVPLARAAARRARALGLPFPAWPEIEQRASAGPRAFPLATATAVAAASRRTSADTSRPEERSARASVHGLAALLQRSTQLRRSLHDGNRQLATTMPWLVTEIESTRRASEEGLAVTVRVLEKLRLRRRATAYAQRVRERARALVERWRPPPGPTVRALAPAGPTTIVPGPRRRHWLIVAAVPIDDVGGGQRSAQLARALVAADDRVTYVARFPRHESVDLALHLEAPGLEILDWDPARLRQWLAGRDETLRVLVELPEAEVVSFAAEAHAHGARVLYDKIDNWAACAWASWYSAGTERELIALADDLVGSAQLLVRQLARGGRSAHLVANAVDTGIFDGVADGAGAHATPPPDLVRGDVTLVYAGSLWGEWFDWQLVAEVAATQPGWSVNLIGDRPARLARALPANVHLLGLKPQTALPSYLAVADVCLIPFVPSPLVDAVSPLKVFEYLAMHRPVVAAPLPELHGMPYVFPALGPAATIAAIEAAVATPPPTAEIEHFRAHNSWQARVRTLRTLVARPTISLIVLCYDNRDVIAECVESLLRARGQTGYQLIVVDNGSRDGSLELLESHAARGDIVLHRNPVNGCSSGRNLGIRLSASEIVVFLDSDQRALFPGWLDPALDVLREHGEVGAVGWSGGWFDASSGRGTTVEQLPDRGGSALARGGFRGDVAYLATSGLVVPRAVLRRTQGFDERLDPTCFEDTDLSFQIKDAGYQLALCPALGVDHRPHATTGALTAYGEVYRRNERYFLDKWRRRPEYFFDLPR